MFGKPFRSSGPFTCNCSNPSRYAISLASWHLQLSNKVSPWERSSPATRKVFVGLELSKKYLFRLKIEQTDWVECFKVAGSELVL